MTVAPPRPIRLRSTSSTRAPARAAAMAAYMPAAPAPMIRTSASTTESSSPRKRGPHLEKNLSSFLFSPLNDKAGSPLSRGRRPRLVSCDRAAVDLDDPVDHALGMLQV